jgi:ABC-2 type transport system permease protein
MRLFTTNLFTTEAKLFLREPLASFFGILFPTVLLLVLGSAIPSFTEPAGDLGGRRPIDSYLPIVLALAIATVTMVTLLGTLAAYREKGVLRRLSATPVSPVRLLLAQFGVNTAALVVGSAAAFAAARLAFGVAAPEHPVGFVLAYLLGAAAMGAVALLIAAVTPNARASTGFGSLVYFPMMFFAGVWTPGPTMPEVARRIADFTPLGAASQAMQQAWAGGWPRPLHLAVLIAYTVVLGTIAARAFRWE